MTEPMTSCLLALSLVVPAAGADLPWPAVEAYRLELRFDPPALDATAEVDVSGVEGTDVVLLLNRGLRVVSAELAGGEAVEFEEGGRLSGRYHSEGRVLRFTLPRAPAAGRATLRLRYGGRGDSPERNEWRGMLRIEPDALRMSEQTIFYPQVPDSLDSPAVQRAPMTLSVDAPADLELFAPGRLVSDERAADRRAWRFALDRPSVLSLVGGRCVRIARSIGGVDVTLLVMPEHESSANELFEAVSDMLAWYSGRFGPTESTVLGVCEAPLQFSWAAQGIIVLGSSLAHGVDRDLLAHEIAHLWWGQSVRAANPGERFLTEGLAEYSSWDYLDRGEVGASRGASWAVEADVALADVRFGLKDYQALAYQKGPQVLRHLALEFGSDSIAAGLAAYHQRFRGQHPDLEDFAAVLDEVCGIRGDDAPWFFRAGRHRLVVERAVWSQAEGAVTGHLAVQITSPEFQVPFDGLVVVEVQCAERDLRVPVAVSGNAADFRVACAAQPYRLLVDPDGLLFAERPAPFAVEGGRGDEEPPRIVGFDLVAGREMRVRFSKNMERGIGFAKQDVAAVRAKGLQYPSIGDMRWEERGRLLVLELRDLELGVRHALPFRGSRFRDLSGNGLVDHDVEFVRAE